MKKLIVLLLTLAMVLTMAACAAAPAGETTAATENTQAVTGDETEQTESLRRITVTVVHADGSSKVFEYETAHEFLGPLLEEEGLLLGEEGPYGLMIKEVDGESAVYETDGAYWALYEGDEYALQGIDSTPIVDGGTYKLEYTRD